MRQAVIEEDLIDFLQWLEDRRLSDPTSTVLRKMVGEIRGIARGATGRTVMWC